MRHALTFFVLLLVFLAYPDDDPVDYPQPQDDGTRTNDEPENYGK